MGIHDVVADLVVDLDLADDLELLEVLFPACLGGDDVLLVVTRRRGAASLSRFAGSDRRD
jgi:hypothetical protein